MHVNKTLELARTLIERPSVTPDDAGCQDLIGARLATAGFHLEAMPFGAVRNLWARRGAEGPVFCFAGHTDVVPAGDASQWHSNPFVPTEREGVLYGRGAADMKASLAAMTEAAVEFVAQHPRHRGSIAFLITSDEEGRARDGTLQVMRVLAERGQKLDWCLIGEPSCEKRLGDTVRIGRRGSLTGFITVRGVEGHVAYPQRARNPIETFAPVIKELYEQPLDTGNEFFPPSSFQIVQIASGGEAPNVIPGKLEARFNIRYSTQWTYQRLQAHVESLLRRHGLDYELRWHLSGEPFLTPVDKLVHAVTAAVEQVTGIRPELSTGGGTSDGRFIAPTGTHVVEFGAVNESIHKANECIPIRDIDTLRRTYLAMLEKMLL